MIKGSLARRYARALMAIGKERSIYDKLGQELNRFADMVTQDKGLREVIVSPVFHHDVKKNIITELCKRMGLSDLITNFLLLLNDKRRLDSLMAIVDAYHEMADEASGRLRAEVVVASELTAKDQERVRSMLGKITGKEVIMEVKVDPVILGGTITRIGGKLYDGSLRTQLKKIQESLTQI